MSEETVKDAQKACETCRHHRTEHRNMLARDGDQNAFAAEMEQLSIEDDPEPFYVCMHEAQKGREQGYKGAEPAPGSSCPLWEAPARQALSPRLEALLARRGI